MSAAAFVPVKTLYGPTPGWPENDTIMGLMEPVGNQNINTWKFGSPRAQDSSVIGATTDAAIIQSLIIEANNSSHGRQLQSSQPAIWDDNLGIVSLLSCAHPAYVPGSKGLSVNYFGTLSISDILGKPAQSSVKVAYVVPGSKPGSLKRIPFANWNTTSVRYAHSFAMTASHALFVFPPVTWDESLLAFSLQIGPAMVWSPDAEMQIVAVPLPAITEDGSVLQQPTFMANLTDKQAFFPLHMTNAWNSDCSAGDLQVLDVAKHNCTRLHFEGAGYRDLSVLSMFMMETVYNTTAMNEKNLHSNFRRFSIAVPTSVSGAKTVHLNSSLVTMEDFRWNWENGSPVPGPTLPRWNRAWAGRRSCFVWGLQAHFNGSASYADQAVIKFDTCAYDDGKHTVQSLFTRPATMFAEPVFIPRPGSTSEDDGIVLVDTFDSKLGISSLYMLNGSDLQVLAILDAPILVPFPVHAEWYGDDS